MKELILTEDGIEYTVWVGVNAKDNWNIIQQSEPDDLWFHVDNVPSAHVILRHRGQYTDKIVTRCAQICRESVKKISVKSTFTVISTQVGNLTLGEALGSVYISPTATITCTCLR